MQSLFNKDLINAIESSLKEAEERKMKEDEDFNKAIQLSLNIAPTKKSPNKKFKYEDFNKVSKIENSPKKSPTKPTKNNSPTKPTKKSPKKDEPIELKNQGNSCFINASLQLIDNLEFTNLNYVDNINIDSILKLLKYRNPDVITDVNDNFYKNEQEDVSVFLVPIVDNLRNYKKINVDIKVVTSYYNCDTPKNSHTSLEPLIHISLNGDDIQQCLNFDQTIFKLDKPTVHNNCTHMQTMFKPIENTQNIIIQLRRYTIDMKKNKKYIKPNAIIKIDGKRFALKGCIIHLGNIDGGHYTYLSFNNGKPDTYINDNKIGIYNQSHLNNFETNGYIYLYSKVK